MNGPQHYHQAEQHLRYAAAVELDAGGWIGDAARYHLAAASIHATLAQAAAAAELATQDDPTTLAVEQKRAAAWNEAFDASEPGS